MAQLALSLDLSWQSIFSMHLYPARFMKEWIKYASAIMLEKIFSGQTVSLEQLTLLQLLSKLYGIICPKLFAKFGGFIMAGEFWILRWQMRYKGLGQVTSFPSYL